MKYRSAFDIIGPVMIGPSSSHTAGAARIGRVARTLFGKQPKKAIISLYGSFAKTYRGHGTDVAVVGGILDFDTDDERIPASLTIAEEAGMEVSFTIEDTVTDHPNTVKIRLFDEDKELELVGISIGGGTIEITELNTFKLKLSGENPAILVVHNDVFGIISSVSTVLANHEINVGHMEVSRKDKGQMALMVIEVDQKIKGDVMKEIEGLENVSQVIRMVE
ncbi:L-serine ammonia-lyase, iron-sulfur-dependent subunit beta [Peribacillus simplex]|uniref:L-serine deaminase n=1 Tax=Peribacillus simplex NBRC 15720 = DSM 1321 TaxID=1349754 RepID=A0A223EJ23_9BACI|nr:L-serine ammonia-lyase, iron-sulfur-dependent subunit beta [Peribacillus simplex]ASS95249.1 L-serine dehydratase, iron-sulfur-dependent subunit beta [Peribacillus simplex NBRC 15720 = DSM 1321]MEC1397925.1 L-serine ammonia-lyase, iron-sulfur-dependent subunit beta [Peribacillus simplex]MED3984096.1 L-serine ammonia-lyase, iron-sulfur-dependent subunit beta [Peribacillus simplex]MED4092568.1 L-serine ammonia-lyase, iron-sulfur-dependent subunit beta [Peribacillus simplex]CAH0152672.1 L-serin